MTEKAGLAWKIRGYPWQVSHRLTGSQIPEVIEWCGENLDIGSYVWAGQGVIVFTDEETATVFKLTWTYD